MATSLSFSDLNQVNDSQAKPWQGEEIVIRGFLYQSEDGQWFLSSKPNLKSCCIGSQDLRNEQILIPDLQENPFLSPSYVVSVRGKLLTSNYPTSAYLLVDASVEPSKATELPLFSIIFILSMILGVFLLWRSRKTVRP